MKNSGFLVLIALLAAIVLLFAGCPSPNNAAVVMTESDNPAPVVAASNQAVITGIPATTAPTPTTAKTGAQVSAPPPTTPFETIFIPDCCSTDTAPPAT
jgi:hypothetical protein